LTHASAGLWLVSFLVGLLVGSTGMGGAALMTPFLILVLSVPPVLAVGTDLAYGALTKIVGAFIHWRQGTVDLRIAGRLARGSVPGAIAGALLISYLRRRGIDVDHVVRTAIGVVLVCVAFVIPAAPSFRTVGRAGRPGWLGANVVVLTTVWGAIVGFLVGFTSVGSGSLIAPFLMLILSDKLSVVVGTDIFHAALLLTATAALYMGIGQVQWHLMPILLVGSLPGVFLGSRLAVRLPQTALRIVLTVLLLATGIKLL